MTFKLAVLQMRVEAGRKTANLQRAENGIAMAAAQGAQVVVLPEALTLGWMHDAPPLEADEIPGGPGCLRLCAAARAAGVYVCAGLIERAGPVWFNAAVLIDPMGNVVLHHRKINELTMAHRCYALGDRLGVVATPLGVFGLMICADAFVAGQVIARTLGVMGAQVILSPCSWAVPPAHDNLTEPYGRLWLENYGAVARDFRLWVVGVSNVGVIAHGPWQGYRCIGNSLVVGPDGEKFLQGPHGVDAETCLLLDIDVVDPVRCGDHPS